MRRGGRVWGGVPLLIVGGFWEGAVPPPQKMFEIFSVKKSFLVHFVQMNISQ